MPSCPRQPIDKQHFQVLVICNAWYCDVSSQKSPFEIQYCTQARASITPTGCIVNTTLLMRCASAVLISATPPASKTDPFPFTRTSSSSLRAMTRENSRSLMAGLRRRCTMSGVRGIVYEGVKDMEIDSRCGRGLRTMHQPLSSQGGQPIR